MALKNKSKRRKKGKLAKGHKAPFRTIPHSEGNVDLFGKVTDPAPSSDLPEGQHLAEVYGIREHGRCSRLRVPLQLSLPAPDGPADGCGWDPSQFVVWRKVSTNVLTRQIHTKTVTLHEALFPVPAAMALASEPTVDDVLHQWLSQSVPGQPIPNADQLQVAWASFGSGGAFSVQVQQNLANLLNNAFAPDPAIVAANLPGTLTVGQLKLNLNRP